MKREVAFRIKREAMGLSQKDIAVFAKVSGSTVSMYKNGQLTKGRYFLKHSNYMQKGKWRK